jgi:hypothetical protein
VARRTINSCMSWSSRGRPVWRCGSVQASATRRRCQPSSVSGLTRKQDHTDLGSMRLTAASSARSAGSNRGREIWRRRTLSWWRSTRISRSLAASPRASSTSACMERHTARYASFDSTRDGLRRVDRAEAYRAAVQHEPAGHRPRPSLRTLQAQCRAAVWREPAAQRPRPTLRTLQPPARRWVSSSTNCPISHRPRPQGLVRGAVWGRGWRGRRSSPRSSRLHPDGDLGRLDVARTHTGWRW